MGEGFDKVISLQKPYIVITNENGRVIGNGANQGWFSKAPWRNVSGQGCGIISSLDLCFYLSGKRNIHLEDYQLAVDEFIDTIVFTKFNMHEFLRGKLVIGITPWQICHYLNRKLKGQYKVRYNGRHGHEDMLNKIEAQLKAGIPVIWSLYRMGKRINLYTYKPVLKEYSVATTTNSHYVNIIGIKYEEEGNHRTMLKISSWGKIYYVDYEEYLDYVGTSLLSQVASNIFLVETRKGLSIN